MKPDWFLPTTAERAWWKGNSDVEVVVVDQVTDCGCDPYGVKHAKCVASKTTLPVKGRWKTRHYTVFWGQRSHHGCPHCASDIPPSNGNNNSHKEVEATLIPFFPCPDPRQVRDIPAACLTRLRIYSDGGVTLCSGGPKHPWHMGLSEN